MIMKKYEWVVTKQEEGEGPKSVQVYINPCEEDEAEYNGLKLELSTTDARQFSVGTKVRIEVEVYGS